MKIMAAADIHGSAFYCDKLLRRYEKEKPDKLLLLGDILYHGPRNELPKDYNPKTVISELNKRKNQILCVRGNCDSEVDQMVLEFPVMAEYAILELNGRAFYATHGHVYHENHMPPMKKGDVLVYGHTHVPMAKAQGPFYVLNPGSVSLPKGGNPPTYAILEGREFRVLDFEGNVVAKTVFS